VGEIDPGLSHRLSIVVSQDATAEAIGSGDVPVLATPYVLTLAERACVAALRGALPDGRTTVGAFAEVDHVRPSPVGAEVDVDAKLIGCHGRRLEFQIVFRQAGEVVAQVQHRRILLDRQRFLERVGASD
jgi:fluoroacetyl-CoA thioesterase